MNEKDIIVKGNEVVYTNIKPKPYNPLHRPKMNYYKFLVALSIYVFSICIIVFCIKNKVLLISICFTIVYFAIAGKRIVIWCIHLYQNKAKDETRLKCLFEPSCSEYMILAIEKYGLIKGIYKGIKRLQRCHYPNGGVDYP